MAASRGSAGQGRVQVPRQRENGVKGPSGLPESVCVDRLLQELYENVLGERPVKQFTGVDLEDVQEQGA